ncbi:MAG: exo-alpha-sialidase [Victivallales bacterium]|nr:exo-alpha-sialidase [Victivallales bacterium]
MAELLDLQRVVADGYHNAFTDLLHWHGHYYLAFRKSEHHGTKPRGKVVILRSTDLATWEECVCLSTGGDDRDPKLIDAGDRLGVIFGTWYPRWSADSLPNQEEDLICHVCLSRDGLAWSSPRQVWGPNYWLWRVFASKSEGFFCSAYHFAHRPNRTERSIHLMRSEDLLDWHCTGLMLQQDGPGEPVLYQPEPDTLHCIIRREGSDHNAWLGSSQAPYADWQWRDLGVMIHAPVVLEVDGQWLVAGRSRPADLPEGTVPPKSGSHTTLWRVPPQGRAEHLLTVPSGGDCSYCGLALAPDGNVLMSYYSQHEWLPLDGKQPTPADVFLATIRV